MPKLLLINPYFKGYVTIPTLGLGYLAGYIHQHSDWNVEIVEPMLQNLSKNDVLQISKDSDYIGLTCYTENRFQCFDLAFELKRYNPHCKIIVGGPHASLFSEEILKNIPEIDMVVRYEGEVTLLEILEQKNPGEIHGLTWRNGNNIIRNKERSPIKNLSQTHYDFDCMADILCQWKDKEVPRGLSKVKHLPIMASRGCPYRCSFCGAHKMGYGLWRGVNPEAVVNQMEHFFKNWDIRYFRFYDPLFYPFPQEIEKFCTLLKEKNMPVSFRIDIRVGTSREILELLWSAGCRVVGFGVESGSNRMLEVLNKRITRKQIEETIQICREIGFWTIGFFMISIPKETKKDFALTRSFFNCFDVYNLQFFMVQPGTQLYEDLKSAGEIGDEIWFDRKYENNIYYSQKIFPGASMGEEDVNFAIRYSYYDFNMTQYSKVIQRHGFFRGSVISLIATTLCFIISMKPLKTIYQYIRIFHSYKVIKRVILKKGVQLYG